MDRNTLSTSNLTSLDQTAKSPAAMVDATALAAHRATDGLADKATEQVDRISGATHRGVNSAADIATTAAEWVAAVPEQAKAVQVRFTESASASIRSNPIRTVFGALAVGYLLGRLARL
jgi:hypothetical protein